MLKHKTDNFRSAGTRVIAQVTHNTKELLSPYKVHTFFTSNHINKNSHKSYILLYNFNIHTLKVFYMKITLQVTPLQKACLTKQMKVFKYYVTRDLTGYTMVPVLYTLFL